jgi:hypothetical protein
MLDTTLAVGEDQQRPIRERLLRDATLSTTANKKRKAALLAGAVVAALALLALAVISRFAPYPSEGPSSAIGTLFVDGVGQSKWVLLDWTQDFDRASNSWIIVEGAEQILIFDDMVYDGSIHHVGYVDRPSEQYTTGLALRYDASGSETLIYEYTAHTAPDLERTDPRKVSFSIDGIPYDLSEGSLFLVRTDDDGIVSVQQIYADMPYFRESESVFDAVNEFAASNDGILAFLKDISENQDLQ